MLEEVRLYLLIGILFSPLAACVAFAVSYKEYSRHYTDKKTPAKLALRSAAAAFIIFLAVALAGGMAIGLLLK